MFFSIEFGIIFFVFFLVYWTLCNHHSLQNHTLLLFNYIILCSFGGVYVALVLACYTLFIYAASHLIAKTESKSVFLTMVAFAILNLSFFKYYPSFKDDFEALLRFFGLDVASVDILLPLGISFYTFASITYLRAVYEARQSPQDSTTTPSALTSTTLTSSTLTSSTSNPKLQGFLPLATYLSFFPTIIAGPIMRSDFFFSQFNATRLWRRKNANLIIMLLLFGIVKKVLIANYVQIYASPILANPSNFNTIELLLGIGGYSIQIYCDFSGYVNLVCAFALMLGFTLPPNFDMPYVAKNLKEFWARWHISLSTFIRDYIYIPLGGSKKGFFLTQVFVLISFGLSGIWHGNTINFMIWGLLHGFGLVIVNIAKKCNFSLAQIPLLSSFITFSFVSFAWVFFCYSDFSDSLLFFTALYQNLSQPIGLKEILLLCGGLLVFFAYPLSKNWQRSCVFYLYDVPTFIKPIVLAIVFIIIFCLMPDGIPNFIYATF
ncbi:MBOAT family protein [Helicobacter fennelliae]|uniref:MBOAT family O-acyltransferase n=1 Tax=Helicobacter fennelliae TaxID=215 RepID=UPI000DF8CF4E|nr:MBOAT family O-acyltransferase [Helicobacter fennelliae]STQ85158.1 alginate O-acetyltransferase AlgI [Helicobacter fennelliae]